MKVANRIERLIDSGAIIEWRPVKDFEGYYEVSNEGDIRSLTRKHKKEEQILKPSKNKHGYLIVSLWRPGKRTHTSVHRVVAQAFIGECPEGFHVNHKNEVKTDNHPENLEYVTPKQNNNYGMRNARASRALKNNPKICVAVESFSLETGKTIKRYPSITEAAWRDGYNPPSISQCLSGKQKFHQGVGWRRAEKEDKVNSAVADARF